jgi:hypothetical protein
MILSFSGSGSLPLILLRLQVSPSRCPSSIRKIRACPTRKRRDFATVQRTLRRSHRSHGGLPTGHSIAGHASPTLYGKTGSSALCGVPSLHCQLEVLERN